MPAQERIKTDYPGVYYIMGKAIATGKPEKIYYIDYRKDGKRIQEKAGRQFQHDMTPAKAVRLRANKIEGRELSNTEKRAAEEAAKEAENSRWTINKLWDLYCENHAENKSLSNEKTKYEKCLRSGLGEKEPCELVPLDVDRLRLKLQKKGKRTMAARVLELLRRTVNYGIKRGLGAPINFKIEIPRLNNQTTEDLSPDQIRKLIEVLDADEDQTAANVMRLALFTGMRRGEIFKLRFDDIDFRRGFITLKDPKPGPDQAIPLNDAVRVIFESIQRDEQSKFVFPGRFPGQHLTDCRKSFARIAKAANFPKGFRPLHGLRHVYASMLASIREVDLIQVDSMVKISKPNQYLPAGYYGRILTGKFSNHLKKHLAEWIKRFSAYDELGSPTIPYISAWQNQQNIIWYEFVSKRFIKLLRCDYHEAPDCFRRSIVERHQYVKKERDVGPKEEILKSNQVNGRKYELREEAKNRGSIDAVYKISTAEGTTHWLKDQAILQPFESDNILISLGNLCIVTKEMEAEEYLKQTQDSLRKSEQNYRKQAIHDNLTGLYNTRYLYSELSELIEKSKLSNQSFSLIFMDIDNFKYVVDTHGHLNASQALQEIGVTIRETLKSPEYGVAYGGDEFVLVLPDSKKQKAMETAEVVRKRIKETPYLQKAGLNIHISASLGVSTYPDDARTLKDLLALADQAMFSVKERGKDLVCGIFYDTKVDGKLIKKIISYTCKK